MQMQMMTWRMKAALKAATLEIYADMPRLVGDVVRPLGSATSAPSVSPTSSSPAGLQRSTQQSSRPTTDEVNSASGQVLASSSLSSPVGTRGVASSLSGACGGESYRPSGSGPVGTHGSSSSLRGYAEESQADQRDYSVLIDRGRHVEALREARGYRSSRRSDLPPLPCLVLRMWARGPMLALANASGQVPIVRGGEHHKAASDLSFRLAPSTGQAGRRFRTT
eukprot:4754188-Pyramimonas_sp.AAC.1